MMTMYLCPVFFWGVMVWSDIFKREELLHLIVAQSSHVIGELQLFPDSYRCILKDDSHPLFGDFKLLPSGRRFLGHHRPERAVAYLHTCFKVFYLVSFFFIFLLVLI